MVAGGLPDIVGHPVPSKMLAAGPPLRAPTAAV
jgi:hypothetical protein